MIKNLLLFSLLFFAFKASAENAALPVKLPPLMNVNIMGGGDVFADFHSSFEQEGDCAGFSLSATEIRAFFREARLAQKRNAISPINKDRSRCQVWGSAVLQGGRDIVGFMIDKTGYAEVRWGGGDADLIIADYFCAACGKKFYSATGKKLDDFRPVIKSLEFTFNPIDQSEDSDPERCAGFVLTEKEVRDFFKGARASSSREYMHVFDMFPCHVQGRMVLEDGREGEWDIGSNASGEMSFLNGRDRAPMSELLFFYCADAAICDVKKFGEPCDIECLQEEVGEE